MQLVPLNKIKPNPNNPRLIKDEKYKQLVSSIAGFPEMLFKRPLVVVTDTDGKLYPLGGNMRLKAIPEALKAMNGKSDLFKDGIPVETADEWTEEQRREFVIRDNVAFGEWDWQVLGSDWNREQLADWGLDVPNFMEMPEGDELIGEEKNKPPVMKITFDSPEQLQQAENDIKELIDRKYQGAYYSVSAGEI